MSVLVREAAKRMLEAIAIGVATDLVIRLIDKAIPSKDETEESDQRSQ